MSLFKGVPALSLKAVGDDGAIEGYAATWTVDQGGDEIKPGAFAASLKAIPIGRVRMLRDHDPTKPIGVWTEAREDERGLFVKGQIVLDTALGAETLALLKAGAIDGLSVGFRAVRHRIDRKRGIRVLEVVDLREVSVVAFPMNPTAVVTSAKAESATARARRILAAIDAARAAITGH